MKGIQRIGFQILDGATSRRRRVSLCRIWAAPIKYHDANFSSPYIFANLSMDKHICLSWGLAMNKNMS